MGNDAPPQCGALKKYNAQRGPVCNELLVFRFISYSEVELQCRSEDNSNFPHMTAAFLLGDHLVGAFSSPSGSKSAICFFSMQRLKLTFWYNIDRCRGGADSIGLPHIGRDAKCLNKSRIPLDEETCELGVGGSIEAVEIAVAEVDVKISSLSGVRQPRILLAGTDDGQILQFKSKSPAQLEQYDRRNVGDGRMGFRVQQLDVRQTTVYAVLPKGSYVCVFGSSTSPASWTELGVSCALPSLQPSAELPASFTELLALSTSASTYRIVEHNFTVYNCGAFMTCSSCSSPETGCDWCLGSHKCVSSGRCAEEKATECVHIKHSTSQITVPRGSSHQISFGVAHLDRLPKLQTYSCRIRLSGTEIVSAAVLSESSVKCGAMKLNYDDPLPNITAPLEFLQGNDVIDRTEVTIYSCSLLAADCSSCVFASASWGCSWCSGRCSHDCLQSPQDVICDRPQIVAFTPSSGPIEGGTEITITGRDLGSTIEDVKDRVFVAGSRCPVTHYEISKMVVCRVEKGTSSGPIRISVGRSSARTAESSQLYSFVETNVFSVYPSYAPVSGGTKINVLVPSSTATFQRNSTSSMTCVVSRAAAPTKLARITATIDGATMKVPGAFEFRPDPTISSVYPLVTFKSGGRMVSVEGSNFDAVLTARMFFVSSTSPPFEIVSKMSNCQIQNATFMFCLTPEVLPGPHARSSYSRLVPLLLGFGREQAGFYRRAERFPLGFAMDNVTLVRNLGHRIQMRVVPDPEFAPFKGIRIHQGDQPLILDGSHLNEAAEPQDYKIFVGSERCYVTLVDSRQLVCNGPSAQPDATDEKGQPIVGGLPLVSVTVGRLRSELGLIEYVDPIATLRLWVLVVTALAALCSLLVLLACLWKKRRLERERDYRKIQMQMEHLESNVRKECKQAFAELQTSIESCGDDEYEAADVTTFVDFLHRLLWEDNGWTHSSSLYASTLPIVETAESESTMSLSEKSMLSSLLIAVLLRNFQYCTDVVLSLLRAHIAKMEKMVSKWLTICLYDSMSQCQAHKYSTLFKALKYQTERGPVDAVTGNARYTINESKLLREIVDCTSVDCLVTTLDGRGPFMVRAIACDTTSQLKQKILDHVYKRTPHSQRPALSSFDLELLCPTRGRMLLSDWSGPSFMKGPTKLNTLSHYGISTQSQIVMVPGEKGSGDYRNSLADSGKSSWSSLDRSSPVYPPSRFCHLSSPSRTLTMEKRKKIDESIPKSIPEVYLTRLLTSKGTVQKYIEDFLESIMFLETSAYPPILKRVFDLLEEEAARNGVSDHRLVQQWKSNLYVLRVWVHLIKNPKILLDVSESVSQDGNLSVVAQTLMDCFSFSEQSLGAHSPSSRLLFAKEVTRLRPLSSDLFRRIRRQPPVADKEFVESLNEVANVRSLS
ncbi:unnamed protein product [Heligmosomoides polygyrus]|uniref:Sema domain-containing protein n=1 Tax=Heligmosomoides polygyrus TaxID=6339 RepID=A0A183FEC0_HELPZ|nr:unnamed protein product [Heligmosomoides polygyrus]